ncbi:MAG TPA: hypothetical protein VGD71_19810 [Kribbella sp.]
MASRTTNASVKVGGGGGVEGSGGDVVLVGGCDVDGAGVFVDGGAEGGWDRSPAGGAVSTARAEGVKVCPVVGAALGAMVGSPGSCGRPGCTTVGAQVGVAVGGRVVVAEGIGR